MNATIPISVDLPELEARLEAIEADLKALLAGQARQETRMSALSDALATLTAEDATIKADLDALAAYEQGQTAKLAALQKAVDDLTAAGNVTPEQLAALTQVNADFQADHVKLQAILPPAPTA